MPENKDLSVAIRRPIVILVALTLVSCLIHGYLDGRWTVAEDLIGEGNRLNSLPKQAGDWELIDSGELDPDAIELLRCYGAVKRIYHSKSLDVTVTVAVMFGPRGPIAVHTPEVCYDSIGTKQARARERQTVQTANGRDELWSVQFRKEPDPDPSIDVWYGWSTGGSFEAANYPRFWMTDTLYKIQLAGPVGNETVRPCEDFLKHFLPQLTSLIAES